MEQDIRWKQRFSNFLKAFHKLDQAVTYIKTHSLDKNKPVEDGVLDDIVKEGLIQRFKYTQELAWNVMKDYATYQGNNSVGGSRDAIRGAFQLQLVSNGEVWMDMIESRNKIFQTYNEKTAEEIYFNILNIYYPAFLEFQQNMELKRGELGKLL